MQYPAIGKSFRAWRKTVPDTEAFSFMTDRNLSRLCAEVDRFYEPGCVHKGLRIQEGLSMIFVASWAGAFGAGERYIAPACDGTTQHAIRYGTAFERDRGFLPKGMIREKAIPDDEFETFMPWCFDHGVGLVEHVGVIRITFETPNAEFEFRTRWE